MSEKDKIQQDKHIEKQKVSQEKTVEQKQPEKEIEKNEKFSKEKEEKFLQQEKDKYMRLFAEFENYKKRTSKERIDLFKTAGKEIIQDLLPVIDDFDRGLDEMKKLEGGKEFSKGMQLIYDKFKKILERQGLREIKIQKGDAFDADLHEAVTQIPAPSKDLKGKIIDVIEKGYQLSDKVIRYPKVIIGQK